MTFKPDPLQTHAKTHNRLSPKRKGGVGELDIPIQKWGRRGGGDIQDTLVDLIHK